MNNDNPLGDVCTLDGDALGDRLGFVQREIVPHVATSEPIENGISWTFRTPSVRHALEQLIEKERACCSRTEFTLVDAPALRLEIRGHGWEAIRDVLKTRLVAPSEPLPTSRFRRWLGLGGFGASASFFVLCVLPIALSAFVGPTLANRLAGLESPLALAALAVVFAAGMKFWLERRKRSNPGLPHAGCDC